MTEHEPWLSLPDEDPPERGLAELMAAARAKAEIMANPPWWKRAVELLRKPPVLALATVVVLIGGVIIVHREPAELAPVASPPASGEVAPVEPAGFGAAQSPPPAPVVEPRVEKKLVGTHGKRAETGKLARPDSVRVETRNVEVSKGHAEEAPVGRDALQQQMESDMAAAQAPVLTATPRAQTPTDSLARCRAAAVNKDCAGLRACAKQLETDDPQFYKANGATIKSCL